MSPSLTDLITPGTVPFLILGLIPGVILLGRRSGRIGRVWITTLVLSYWLLSTPVFAAWLVAACSPAYAPLGRTDQTRAASAVVVLGAGNYRYESRGAVVDVVTRESALRVAEAARIYQLLDRPWMIVAGGHVMEGRSEAQIMGDALEQLGVPPERIVLEEASLTTHDHGLYVPPLLRARGVLQFVMVTSQTHMRRSLRVFRLAGLTPIPSTPEVFSELHTRSPIGHYLPSETALAVSKALIHDGLGMSYYWFRGWI